MALPGVASPACRRMPVSLSAPCWPAIRASRVWSAMVPMPADAGMSAGASWPLPRPTCGRPYADAVPRSSPVSAFRSADRRTDASEASDTSVRPPAVDVSPSVASPMLVGLSEGMSPIGRPVAGSMRRPAVASPVAVWSSSPYGLRSAMFDTDPSRPMSALPPAIRSARPLEPGCSSPVRLEAMPVPSSWPDPMSASRPSMPSRPASAVPKPMAFRFSSGPDPAPMRVRLSLVRPLILPAASSAMAFRSFMSPSRPPSPNAMPAPAAIPVTWAALATAPTAEVEEAEEATLEESTPKTLATRSAIPSDRPVTMASRRRSIHSPSMMSSSEMVALTTIETVPMLRVEWAPSALCRCVLMKVAIWSKPALTASGM